MSNKHFPDAREHLKLGKDAHVVDVIIERGKGGPENAVILVYFPAEERRCWAVYYPGPDGHQVHWDYSLRDAQRTIEEKLPARFQLR